MRSNKPSSRSSSSVRIVFISVFLSLRTHTHTHTHNLPTQSATTACRVYVHTYVYLRSYYWFCTRYKKCSRWEKKAACDCAGTHIYAYTRVLGKIKRELRVVHEEWDVRIEIKDARRMRPTTMTTAYKWQGKSGKWMSWGRGGNCRPRVERKNERVCVQWW